MIEFVNLTKKYDHGVCAIDNVSLKIDKGEFAFLVGPSGSGKSTFLRLLIKEEEPTSGKILVDGKDITRLKKKEIPYLRRKIGFVFQDFRLLYDRTVEENIVFALRVVEASEREIKTQLKTVLQMVGLSGKEKFYPNQLSGGEQQRVALARALATKPPIIIADEPTGNLDPKNSLEIMQILDQINQKGITVIISTHDKSMVDYFRKRVITLDNGEVIKDVQAGTYA